MPSLPHHASGRTRSALRACRAQVLQTGEGVGNKPNTARFLAARRRAHGCVRSPRSALRPAHLHLIEFVVSVEAGALLVVHAQGPVPQQARVCDAIANGEVEALGAKHIP
jgi:hypothetical protein